MIMYLEEETGLAFLAHPRTASKSTCFALCQEAGFTKVGPHHYGIDYVAKRPWFEHDPDDLTAFCVVRDHVDAIGSWARLLRPNVEFEYPMTWEDCRSIVQAADPHLDFGSMYPLIYESDRVLKYEDIPGALNEYLEEWGLPAVDLPDKNTSSRPDPEEEFRPSAVKWIEKTFRAEMIYFGYLEEDPADE